MSKRKIFTQSKHLEEHSEAPKTTLDDEREYWEASRHLVLMDSFRQQLVLQKHLNCHELLNQITRHMYNLITTNPNYERASAKLFVQGEPLVYPPVNEAQQDKPTPYEKIPRSA